MKLAQFILHETNLTIFINIDQIKTIVEKGGDITRITTAGDSLTYEVHGNLGTVLKRLTCSDKY